MPTVNIEVGLIKLCNNHIKKLEDIACFCHHLTLPRTFHVYGDLYWKAHDTFWTVSFLYYNLSTIRGYHCIVHVFPHSVVPKMCWKRLHVLGRF